MCIHTLHLLSTSAAFIAWYHCTFCESIQAVQLGSTEVSTGQLLGAAAVAGLLTFAAVVERKAIKRCAQFYSMPLQVLCCCVAQSVINSCMAYDYRLTVYMHAYVSHSRIPVHVSDG